MNLKSTSRFLLLLDGFLYILVFPLMIREARAEGSRAFDLEQYLINHYLQDEIKDLYNTPASEASPSSDDDNEYPYEQLLNFVKETKRILQSPYDDRKQVLQRNFGRYYNSYLRGDHSDSRCPNTVRYCPPIPALGLVPPPPSPVLGPLPPFSVYPVSYNPRPAVPLTPSTQYDLSHLPGVFSGGKFNNTISTTSTDLDRPRAPVPPSEVDSGKPEVNPCEQIVRLVRPQRLKGVDGKEHFILNLGNEFVQEVKIVQCSKYQDHCGDEGLWPETYEKVCEQSYNSYKTLFSVPVNKKINILDQNLHVFEVSSGCHCRLRKRSR